jgi:hypothetical protein
LGGNIGKGKQEMKIENIGQIKEIEQIHIISEYAVPKFAEGQILIA